MRSEQVAAFSPSALTLQMAKQREKKIKNPRLREALAEQSETSTLPTKNKGSKKKKQREKHEKDFEKELEKFSGKVLTKSEGSIFTGGHSMGRHGGDMSDEDLMARNIRVASKFQTNEDQRRAFAAVLKEKKREIEQWLNQESETRLALSIDLPDDVSVKGFKKLTGIGPRFMSVDESSLTYVVAILQKDSVSLGNPWGLVTCYPSEEPAM